MNILVPVYYKDNKIKFNTAYINYIIEAGYTPLAIFPGEDIDVKCRQADALLLPGGIDLDPTYYGVNNVASYNVDPDRDDFERSILHTMIDLGKPVLGICRGFQLIAREFVVNKTKKLAFRQHISSHNQEDQGVDRNHRFHNVMYSPSLLYGGDNEVARMFVNSMHHQCLVATKQIEDGIVNAGDYDILLTAITNFYVPKNDVSVVEGICIPALKIHGVQWHPEELKDVALLRHVVEEAYGGDNSISKAHNV